MTGIASCSWQDADKGINAQIGFFAMPRLIVLAATGGIADLRLRKYAADGSAVILVLAQSKARGRSASDNATATPNCGPPYSAPAERVQSDIEMRYI